MKDNAQLWMNQRKRMAEAYQSNHHHPKIDFHLQYPIEIKQQVIEMDFHVQE
jgi:hypothetical protein